MKSIIVERSCRDNERERDRYSELQILKSAAGHYLGTTYQDPTNGNHPEPGTRDSEYFRDKSAAETLLRHIEQTADTSRLRTAS